MSELSSRVAHLRGELQRAARIPDVAERTLEVVAIVDEAAESLHAHPVVVGGMAVYFWTASDDFFTYDIDVVMDVSEQLAQVLDGLGFARSGDGRHWVLEGTEVFLEAPSSRLDRDADVIDVELPSGRTAHVLSRVDMILDRLDELQATGHLVVGQQALALIGGIPADEEPELDKRAEQRRVSKMLDALRALGADIAAGRSSPSSDEMHQIARAALRAEYAAEER